MTISTDVNKMLLAEIFETYVESERKMLQKIANKAKRGVVERGWAEQKLSDVQKLKKELEAITNNTSLLAKSKVSDGILKAYLFGVASANKDHKLPKTILNEVNIPDKLKRLILETNLLIDSTSFMILRNTTDVYRKVISETAIGVLTGTDTRLQVAQDSLNAFAAQGITGFVDKMGRRWDMASYIEMATRTATSRAALQGHIDRQIDIGNDLVIVSSFGSTCPLCAPWGGKVLSINGGSEKYPSLDSAQLAGLFHPNCKHTITAYFPDITDDLLPHEVQYDPVMYNNMQQQRHNERQIRKWKRIEAVALSPAEQLKSANKIKYWQSRQRQLIKDTGLIRKYNRENPNKAR